MSILRTFAANHGHPEGLMGRLIAWRLARVNRAANEWAVSLLALTPSDQVLEIGFGPGLGLEQIKARVPQGFVAGVDTSKLMLQTASRRNAAAIAAGCMELKDADMTALPYPDDRFDKGLAVQVVNYLPDPLAGVHELFRVMKPNGRAVLYFESPEKFAGKDKLLKGIYHPYTAEQVLQFLRQGGFGRAWYETKQWSYGKVICALAEK